MRTGIPLQQKIHVDEHENRKKEKEKHENIWIVDVFHECPIHIAISVSLTFMNARQLSHTGVNEKLGRRGFFYIIRNGVRLCCHLFDRFFLALYKYDACANQEQQ